MAIVADHCQLGKRVVIHETASIRARNVVIEDNVKIREGVTIHCKGDLFIGRTSIIGRQTEINCHTMTVGRNFCAARRVIIGGGGIGNHSARIEIGDYCFIGEEAFLDCGEGITLGDRTSISNHVSIYTHGGWQNVLDGYGWKHKPVVLGSNVYIGARCLLLPDIQIGDGTVIGAGSTVQNHIPKNSLYVNRGGKPVLLRDIYPAKLSPEEVFDSLEDVLTQYVDYLQPFGIHADVTAISEQKVHITLASGEQIVYLPSVHRLPESGETMIGNVDEKLKVVLAAEGALNGVVFDLSEYRVYDGGQALTPILEDLRNFLRRRGIRFDTEEHFQSLTEETASLYKTQIGVEIG